VRLRAVRACWSIRHRPARTARQHGIEVEDELKGVGENYGDHSRAHELAGQAADHAERAELAASA